MSARCRFSLSLCLLFGASSCGGGGDPIQEICELTLSCACSLPPYATVEACVADLNEQTDDLKVAAMGAGLTFDQGCVDRTLNQFHDELGCSTDFSSLSATCSLCAVIHGDVSVGGACTSDDGGYSNCAADLRCENAVCVDPCARLAAGAACVKVDGAFEVLGICADGLYCDTAVTKTCTPRQDVGAACFGFDDCKDGLACGADNTCGAEPGAGEACVFVCAGELVCEASICVVPPGEGEPCTGACASGLECGTGDICVPLDPLLCEVLDDN